MASLRSTSSQALSHIAYAPAPLGVRFHEEDLTNQRWTQPAHWWQCLAMTALDSWLEREHSRNQTAGFPDQITDPDALRVLGAAWVAAEASRRPPEGRTASERTELA